MNIPKEKLSLIGISIKVNRKARLKETKSGKWNQMNFSDGICSQNTLIKIEHGQVSRFIGIYEDAANRLGLKLGYFPEIDAQIEKITPKLYKATEIFDVRKIKNYSDKLLAILEEYKFTLWYCDLYNLIFMFSEYYVHYSEERCIGKDYLEYYIDMIEEFDLILSDMIKHIVFSSSYLCLLKNKIAPSYIEKIYEETRIEESNYICNIIDTMLYSFVCEKTMMLLRQLDRLEEVCERNNNLIRLLDGYSITINYLSVMGKNDVDFYATRLVNKLNENKVSEVKLKEYYFGLGMAFYEIGDYKQSLDYFLLSSKYDIFKNGSSFVYIASVQRKLGKVVDIPYYTDEQINKLSDELKSIYKYYKMNEDIPAFIKQKYIMEEILPRLVVKDEVLIGIIKDELLELTRETNHYKDSVIFDIRCRELLDL